MSENHENSQNVTNLSVEQLNAIDLLIQGMSDREVAEQVNVSRETITRWRNENANFQAELNRKRQEIWGAAEDKLRELVSDAVDVLETELQNGNLKAAIEVLKAVGMYGNISVPSGAIDPDVIILKQAEKWANNELAKELPSADPLGDFLGRVIQDMVKTAIEPITEYHASGNSYGFRPKRNCHDAIEHLFKKLAQRGRCQWVVEGDIEGCFDNIEQNHILENLEEWNTPEYIRTTIERMLRARIFEQGTYIDPERGTPQGGILSPMLANVALTTLDRHCEQYNRYNPIVRYADDFVVTCRSKEEAEAVKNEITAMLKDKIGLTLSEEKTQITNVQKATDDFVLPHDGFNFLGFNIRKYNQKSPKSKYHEIGKLLIKPQKEKVHSHLRELKRILNSNKQAKQESMIRRMNPVLQGWAMYNRFAVSKEIIARINSELWKKLWMWSKRIHPNKPRRWIMRRYFTTKTGAKWKFRTKETALIDTGKIPIVRYVKVKSDVRVHDKEAVEYWKKREYVNALGQIYSIKIEKLFKRQNGKCFYCGQQIEAEQIEKQKIHVHHLNPRSQGGDERLNNLRLLHQQCHTEAHSIMTREQMSYWAKMKGDYAKREKINLFAVAQMREAESTKSKIDKVIRLRRSHDTMERRRTASAKRATQMVKEGRI